MISIIVCSKRKDFFKLLADNIADTIFTEYEIVHINNSENKHSIFSAYNEGVARSKYPYLCFIHDDVFFHSKNWGERIIKHLQLPNVGICGLAGRDFVPRVPASWKVNLPSVNIIQSDKTGKKRSKTRFKPKGFGLERRPVILLDGVLLCMKRELMDSIKFDEKLKGFHGYDFDICIQSTVRGYENYVMDDIVLEHFSRGNPDASYYRNLINIFKKWNKHLPLIKKNASVSETVRIHKIEKKGLSRLLGKLVRRGFSTNEIIPIISYFANQIDLKNKKLRIKTIRLEVLTMKFLNFPIYKFQKTKHEV